MATVVPGGTTINDTVLSLYCDPFEPTDAQANLVAYDDDGGDGLLSAFDGSEGAFLQPNTTYWLVISLFSTTSIGEGDYEISVGGDIIFGQPVPTMDPKLLAALAGLLLLLGVVLLGRRLG